jgi:asparaginyl-tRNA synthetase
MTVDRQRLRALRQAAVHAVFTHYDQLGLTWIDDAPSVVPITGACENVSTLYRVSEGQYLAQTAQLFLEVELQHHAAVYASVHSFRADRSDSRHLNEFGLIEEEFSWPSAAAGLSSTGSDALLDMLLTRTTAALAAMLAGVLDEPATVSALGGDVSRIERAVELARTGKQSWPAISYREALALLNGTGRLGHLEFGADFGPEHEAVIVELVSAEFGPGLSPVFVTRFPEQIKFFNMKVDPEDSDVVLSADLLLPTAGESVGAAVREDHHTTLVRRLKKSSMLAQLKTTGAHTIRDFDPYLDLITSGRVPPHAGYGIGLERVLQYVVDAPDIRAVSGLGQLLWELQPHALMNDPA